MRSTGADAGAISLQSPLPDAAVIGALELSWQPVPGAVRYRVVLVDAENGEVIEAGHTAATRLPVEPEALAGRLDSREPRVLHWIVRARLLDGTEVSSEPRLVTWSER